MFSIRSDYAVLHDRILGGLRAYLTEHPGLRSLVVGVSGGIDSALTCALAWEALRTVTGVRLFARSLPIESNTEGEIRRAEQIGTRFSHDYLEKDLTRGFEALYADIVAGTGRGDRACREERIRRGNLKARVRMTYLFDLAHAEHGMVLSTDNYTEYLIGFWTLHGDVGNFGMLQFLWKTEVYGLARHLAERFEAQGRCEDARALAECIDAVPTDGLGISESDFDQLGVRDYETVDRMLLAYLNGDRDHCDHPLIVRHLGSAFKRLDPLSLRREALFAP